MTKKEFEERTGYVFDDAEWRGIEAMYMAAGEMDKDAFCRHWKECGKNPLTQELSRQCQSWEESCSDYEEQVADMEDERREIAAQLLGKSCAYQDTDFRHMAVRLIGEKEVVSLKVKMGLPLWEEDKEYILESLVRRG